MTITMVTEKELSFHEHLLAFVDNFSFSPKNASNAAPIAIRYAVVKEIEKRTKAMAERMKEELLAAVPNEKGTVYEGNGVSVVLAERKESRRLDREKVVAFIAKKMKMPVEKAAAIVEEQCSTGGDGTSIVVNTKVIL